MGGRKSSAPRLRKSLQSIKSQAQVLRKSTTEHVKSLPVKPRTVKTKIHIEVPIEVSEPVSLPIEIPIEVPIEVPPSKEKRVSKQKQP